MRPTASRAARAAPAQRPYWGFAGGIVPCPCFRSSRVGGRTLRDGTLLYFAIGRSVLVTDALQRSFTLLGGRELRVAHLATAQKNGWLQKQDAASSCIWTPKPSEIKALLG